jgi:hypothetical protein
MSSKVTLNLPRVLWSAKDTLRLAQNSLASIKIRTSKGIDANGVEFKGYSKNAIYVSKRGARLKPKGGRPSRTGRSIFYALGYKQYKHDSRQRSKGDSAEVDLVLSGNMLNNLVVKEATVDRFVIGLTKHAQYGYAVNEDREFLGLTKDDQAIIVRAVGIEIRKRLL